MEQGVLLSLFIVRYPLEDPTVKSVCSLHLSSRRFDRAAYDWLATVGFC